MPRIAILLLLMLPGMYCISQEKDTLYLFNGQILIGDIKNARLGILTIDETDLKLINIKFYKIKYLKAVQAIFRIETNTKRVYFSTLNKTDLPGVVQINDGNQTVHIALTDIAELVAIQKGFFKRLDGTAGLGFSYTKSSEIGQLTLNSKIYFATRKIDYQLLVSAIYSIDSSSFSRDNESVQLFGSYSISSTWFAAAQITYQRNLELSLSSRFQELAGAGNKLILERNLELFALSGLSFGQEHSTLGTQTVSLEIPFMLRFDYFKYKEPNLQLNVYQTLYVSLSQSGRIRYDGSASINYELIHNFYLGLNFYTYFDSRPPEVNSSKVDYGTALTISYKF